MLERLDTEIKVMHVCMYVSFLQVWFQRTFSTKQKRPWEKWNSLQREHQHFSVNRWRYGTSSLLFLQEVQQKSNELLHFWKRMFDTSVSITTFEVFVSSSSLPVVVYSDHNPLVFIHKLKAKNQWLLKRSLMLQEYVLDIRHIKGKNNVIADCLSRA